MTKRSRFEALLEMRRSQGGRTILDGAVGTELDNRGADTSSRVWSGLASILSPDLLFQIHKDYIDAGADIIVANTFRTTAYAFQHADVTIAGWEEAAVKAVEIAKKAAGGSVFVAGSVAPLDDCFSPKNAPSYRDAYPAHLQLCQLLKSWDIDILWLETFGVLEEIRAAADAAGAVSKGDLPIVLSMTTTKEGRLISGESLWEAIPIVEKVGVSAVCVNCIPTPYVEIALNKMISNTSLPLGVYANLGIPEETQDWTGTAYLSPHEYAALAKKWPVAMIGGCCGSTPAHIQALSEQFAISD